MKIFVSIVVFAIAIILGASLDGLLGGAMSSDLDCFNFAVTGVVVVLLVFISGENKDLKDDIAQLKKMIQSDTQKTQDGKKENDK